MKETPIIFNSQMVRSLLLGAKTQTRRVIKEWHGDKLSRENGANVDGYNVVTESNIQRIPWTPETIQSMVRCPYGEVGDRLWVKETYRLFDSVRDCACEHGCSCHLNNGKPYFKADSPDENLDGPWIPSIHMPRKFSRLVLEIKGVRAERLQSMCFYDWQEDFCPSLKERDLALEKLVGSVNQKQFAKSFWDEMYGKSEYSWDSNPWVWVIRFMIVEVR